MRKITKEAIEAFENAKPFNKSNMVIEVLPNVTIMKLYGNKIAYQYNDPERTLSIDTCGYKTDTTKERLNGIDGVSIKQIKDVWYLNDEKWDGEYIDVKKQHLEVLGN